MVVEEHPDRGAVGPTLLLAPKAKRLLVDSARKACEMTQAAAAKGWMRWVADRRCQYLFSAMMYRLCWLSSGETSSPEKMQVRDASLDVPPQRHWMLSWKRPSHFFGGLCVDKAHKRDASMRTPGTMTRLHPRPP